MNKFLHCNVSEGCGEGLVPGAAGTVWQNNGGGGFTRIHRAEQSNKIQVGRTRQELSTAGGRRRGYGSEVQEQQDYKKDTGNKLSLDIVLIPEQRVVGRSGPMFSSRCVRRLKGAADPGGHTQLTYTQGTKWEQTNIRRQSKQQREKQKTTRSEHQQCDHPAAPSEPFSSLLNQHLMTRRFFIFSARTFGSQIDPYCSFSFPPPRFQFSLNNYVVFFHQISKLPEPSCCRLVISRAKICLQVNILDKIKSHNTIISTAFYYSLYN